MKFSALNAFISLSEYVLIWAGTIGSNTEGIGYRGTKASSEICDAYVLISLMCSSLCLNFFYGVGIEEQAPNSISGGFTSSYLVFKFVERSANSLLKMSWSTVNVILLLHI